MSEEYPMTVKELGHFTKTHPDTVLFWCTHLKLEGKVEVTDRGTLPALVKRIIPWNS